MLVKGAAEVRMHKTSREIYTRFASFCPVLFWFTYIIQGYVTETDWSRARKSTLMKLDKQSLRIHWELTTW